jgi:hypothetical protein
MRSGGKVSTQTPKGSEDSKDEKPQAESAAKCKGATTIPIFLKSEYNSIVHGDDRAM